MKKKLYFFFTFAIFFTLFGFFLGNIYFDKNIDSDPIENSIKSDKNNTGGIFNDNQINEIDEKVSSGITIKEALSLDGHFNMNMNRIKNDFNYTKLLIDEFGNVKNIDDFKWFEEKFGNQKILFISLKLKDEELFLKYFDFLIESENIESKSGLSKNELLKILKNIYDNYSNKGFFDEMGYIDSNGEYDYFRLSLMSLDYNKKINICRDGYQKEDDFNSCKKFVTYMLATTENKYCDKFEKIDDKKWCEDTLELIK